MFRSIRWRIGLPYVLLIIITMIGLSIYLSNFLRQTYLANLETDLAAEARLASEIIVQYLSDDFSSEVVDQLAKTWAKEIGTRVTIIALDGTVVGESHENRAEMDNHINRPEVEQALESGQGISTRYSQTLGDYLMYVAVPAIKDGRVIGIVRVALPMSEIEATVQHLLNTLLSVTFMATIIAALLAIWIPGRTMKPLRDLTQAATKLSSGILDSNSLNDQPIQKESNDEIGQLTTAFNQMTTHLRTQIDALQTERCKMAAVLNVMTDGVLIVDSDGMIQLINPAAEDMFGVEEQSVLGSSLIKGLRIHQIAELWQLSKDSNERQFTIIEIAPKNMYLQAVATSLGDVLPGSSLLLFQDLTRIRRLETIRQDFISNISHELRTPLASLKALTETLREGALQDSTAAQHFLERIEIEVDALSLIVSELLELSRIESGRVPLKMTAISPITLVAQAIERLQLQAERAEIDLKVECPQDLPAILADENRLVQELVNNLQNAIKFTPQGG